MIRLIKGAILFLFLLTVNISVIAQTKSIVKGTVVDEDGLSIIGAVVSARTAYEHRNKIIPVVTDIDGNFSISVTPDIKAIVVSCLGMQSREVSLEGDISNLNIVMSYQAKALEQVVVTGYSQTTTKKITGSVGIVTSDVLKDKPLATIDAMLQG